VWCHSYFTGKPKEFMDWILETIGEEKYTELKQKAETVTKIKWDEELANLQKVWLKLSTGQH
jgi:hypothetical protein